MRICTLSLISLLTLICMASPLMARQDTEEAVSAAATVSVSGLLATPAGDPVEGATVELLEIRRGSLPVMVTVTSAVDGSFELGDVAPGQYGIRIQADGRATILVAIRVTPDMDLLSFEMTKGIEVRGRLVDAASGEPIVSGRIVSGMASAESDDEGRFTLSGLAQPTNADEVVLSISSGDYLRLDRSLKVAGRAQLDAGNIDMVEGARLVVKLADETGEPVAGAGALLYPLDLRRFPSRGTDNIQVVSDETGTIDARGLPHDTRFALQVTSTEFPSHVFTPIEVGGGGSMTDLDLVMAAGYPVSGRVVDASGAPLEGATVRLAPVVNPIAHFTWNSPEQEQGFTGNTDASGRFRLDDVAFGTFLLEINAPGYRSNRRAVYLGINDLPAPAFVVMQPALGSEAESVRWLPSMADALDRSQDENLPVMLFMTMDGEVANEYTAANTLKQPGIVLLANQVLPVLSSAFEHSDDPANDPCSKYGSVTCFEHMAAEGPIAAMFLTVEYSEVPQWIFLRPSGDLIERRMFYAGFETWRNMIVRALREVNPERALAAAASYYENLVDQLRYGSSARRANALRDLLVFADNIDEVARTALLTVDPSTLSPDQEMEILDRFLPGIEANRVWFVARLLQKGSPALRAEAIRRLRADAAAGDEAGDEAVGAAAFETMALALEWGDFPLRTALEPAMGIERADGKVRFSGIEDRGRRQRVALALARHADPAVLPHLFGWIRDGIDARRRNDCALALLRYPVGDVLPFLLEELERGGPDRAILARVIGELGDPSALAALRAAMRDDSVILRVSVARSLGLLGDTSAQSLLRGILVEEDIDDSVRVAVAAALLDLGDESSMSVLIELSDHPVHGPRARARLREAYTARPPRGASEWEQWWNERGGKKRP